jgi:type IV pilus assembly protein PilA
MRNRNFWLIIIIIGTIIIANFLGRAEFEAQENVRAINISQIAFFYEESRFATSIEELSISDKLKMNNYEYSIIIQNQTAFNYAIPRYFNLKSYVGAVYFNPFSTNELTNQTAENQPLVSTILCEANFSGRNKPELPTMKNGGLNCGKGTTKIGS